jgi:hypothetical protein
MTWMLMAMVVALAAMIVVLERRVRTLEAARPRMDRMAEAMSLLAETAEAGLAAVSAEIEKLQRAPVVSAPRAAVSRRVVRAASEGEPVEHIARRESLSEGEVRLHLALAKRPTPSTSKTARSAASAPAPVAAPVAAAPKKGARRVAVRA